VARNFPPVHRFFRNKVDAQEVDDLVQRSFLACLEAAHRIRPDASVRAFLLACARRQLLKFLYERGKHARRRDVPWKAAGPFAQTPTHDMGAQQDARALLRALRRLPLDLQVTVELFYWEELPVAEIATVLGVPQGTVKSRLFRARESLRAEIGDLERNGSLWRTTVDSLAGWSADVRRAAAC
jgi:RNA polymerase sigma-70 factor (ECF subfamily)